ncbi:multicopper oxidase domain-containing protein [Aestuariimicrobium ganziense]|uniref:multicopper oxidase domain-containing protein n=1 Tax=Aestuariimicrobium ganziense TaxID=2773677 RepID=UPI001943A12C|nr:multicopper oxidase domain-containing protein [Aestuariimicrobium ganziense]
MTLTPGPAAPTGQPGAAVQDRSAWHRRASRPVVVWMAALVVAALVSLVVDLRWLLVHMATLGVVTNSILIWGQHFTEALLKVPLDASSRTWQVRRIALLNAGVVATMVGMVGGWPWLTMVGATGVAAALVWYAVDIVRQLRRALPSRFRVVVKFYAVAALLLVVGAGLGATMAFPVGDPWAGRLLLAHLAANLLGFVGLTAVATLITLWPTVLRTQMVPGQDRAGQRSLVLLLAGVLVTVAGALIGLRPLAAAGLAIHLLGLVVIAVPLVACAVRKPPRDLPGYGLAAAFGWLVVLDALAIAVVASRWNSPLQTVELQPLTPALVVGFLLQLLLAAMSYLMPTVMGGGPVVVRASSVAMQRFGALRTVVLNGALIGWLASTDPLATTVSQVLVVLALAASLPATVHMIASHVRTSRALAARDGTDERRPAVEREPVTETPVADLGRRDLLEAAAGIALAATAVVAPPLLGSRPSVAASGRTVAVEVAARGMRYHPDQVVVSPGDRIAFTLRNDDAEVHDLVLGSLTTGRLAPGATGSFTTDPISAPTVAWCSVGQHRAMGMELQIVTDESSSHRDSGSGTSSDLERVTADLTQPPGLDFATRDARLPQLPGTRTHDLTLTVTEPALEVAPGVTMAAMVYNDQVMGPLIRVRRGDRVQVVLDNQGSMGHSIDFHAGDVSPDEVMRTINPGEKLDYRFEVRRAGIWLYHCSTAPMSAHLSAGMYGALVAVPEGVGPADVEYVLVQSELHLAPGTSPHPVSLPKIVDEQPDFVVFNGHANQYVHAPLTARVGQRVRIWLLAAGPSRGISFHVVGSQFDTVWKEGAHLLDDAEATGTGAQALQLGPAQGGFVEMVFREPGRYTFVNHSFVDAERGARGFIDVT